MKGDIKHYFDWEGTPAILVERDEESSYGFYIPREGASWTNATSWNVLDWYKDGEAIDQDEFEVRFGIVGQTLPNVPSF